jgi:serine/threonine protein kinase
VKIAIGIALAMRHLHRPPNPIKHRDLKPANIVLDDHFEPHLIDFGLAKEEDGGFSPSAGTPYYMAPEASEGNQGQGLEIDVYSYGIVLWEILSGSSIETVFPGKGETRPDKTTN